MTVGNYELAMELLYNLKQVNYAEELHETKERAEQLFLSCKIAEALPLLESLTTSGDVRVRYLLALIYDHFRR